MVELWVSLIRNAACLLKSLLPPHYSVMQPLISFPLFSRAGQSLDLFTGLEGFIGLLQIAGAGFNLWKGTKGLTGGIVTAEYVVRWRNALSDYDLSGEGNRREIDMLSDVLGRQDAANNRRIMSGICQLVIGVGFLCLASFSWKLAGVVTAASAVVILEIALAVLLTIAVAGVSKVFKVTKKVQTLEHPTASDVDIVEFLAPLATNEFAWEPDVRVSPTVLVLKEHMEDMSNIGRVVSETRLEDYQRLAQVARRQAMLDAFIILLNVAAFLGYGAIPLDVFFPKRSMFTTLLPPGPTAWWGNFVGDLAWTIEPATIFLAPILLLRGSQPNLRKIKSE